MGLRRPTLDDVFLQLTGQPSSEDGDSRRLRRSRRRRRRARDESCPVRTTASAVAARRRARAVTDSARCDDAEPAPLLRQPDLLVFSTIQPVMFVLLFVYVFGGAVGLALPPGVTYVDYLLPGIFVQSVTFRASNTAVGLSQDLARGVIDRFRSMPMARSAVLVGRTTADLVHNILTIGLMIGVGYLVGFRFQAGVGPAVACVAVVAAFGLR